MAHKKATGSKSRQGSRVAGKRLGLKASGESLVRAGNILIRQRGTQYHPGKNVGLGRDYTLYSTVSGIISFRTKLGKKFVDVKPVSQQVKSAK